MLLSVTFYISKVPTSKPILRPVIVLAVKVDPFQADLYDLCMRLFINVAPQATTTSQTYSHMCLVDSLRITIAVSATLDLHISLADVINAF